MEIMEYLFNQPNIRFINHSNDKHIFQHSNNALASFAIDDAIATTVGESIAPPTVRMWVHDKTIVLGIPDSRLPFLEDGLHYVKEQGYHAVIRNSGGLAVLLNSGVLNMSLILPSNKQLSIHDGYNIMYQLIQKLFKQYTSSIDAYEIKGSYCPGDYDLSIGGIKFAGISQRRVRNGVAVQIYIDIEGSSHKRATIVRDFYTNSIQNETTKYHYPEVKPEVMGAINTLLNVDFTVNQVTTNIKHLFTQMGKTIATENLLDSERDIFLKRMEQMRKRNEKIYFFNPN